MPATTEKRGKNFAIRSSFELEEVFQNLAAVLREDAFGMELDAPDGKLLVFDAHDFAFIGFRGDLENA